MKFLNLFLFVFLIGAVKHSYGNIPTILKCKFDLQEIWKEAGSLYTSTISDLKTNKNKQLTVTGATGKHLASKTDNDVHQLRILNLDIPSLPKGLGFFTNVVGFSVMNSNLKNIQSNDFDGLENLQFVGFVHNRISTILANTFNNLHFLKIIDLRNNKIKEIVSETFSNNFNLEQIWLTENKIEFLGPLLFSYSKKLNYVDLNSNTCVSEDYTGTTAIEQIKKGIEKCLKPEEKIKQSAHDEEIEKMMKKLSEKDVEISNLKTVIKNMTQRIEELVKEAYHTSTNSKNMKMIKITCNFDMQQYLYTCTTIDNDFNRHLNKNSYQFEGKHMKHQKNDDVITLIMEKISLIYLTNDIFESFPNLEIATLNNLVIKYVTKGDLKSASNLKCLTMNENEIKTLDEFIFEGAGNLEIINIESNLIEDISPKTFDGLRLIKKISLQNNKIKKLHVDSFKNLLSLKEVILSSNQLSFLDGQLFRNSINLIKINFDKNNLREIGEKLLSYSKDLEFVNFKDNLCIEKSTRDYQVNDIAFVIKNCCKKPSESKKLYNCGNDGWNE